jgi:dTDP-glucose 4,6-dehydratase
MKLLVTGGAGFLGSHFVRAVLADLLPGLAGASVTVFDNLSYAGAFANLGAVAEDSRLDFVPGDVTDVPVVEAALRGHDAIVHFAAAAPGACGEVVTRSNVVGTQVLLDAAVRRGVGRFVQVSSGRVYGSIGDGAWDETAGVSPVTPYAASKAGADLLALACHRTSGLPVVVTRAADTYGPRQQLTGAIPRAVIQLLDGRAVPVAPEGGEVREWLHVDDHCRAVALALARGRPGEIYHVGGSIELSDRDLIAEILEECGATWDRVTPAEDAPGGRYALNDEKIRRELGWQPQVEFLPGLSKTVRWYRENPEWWRPLLYY